jgi:hypothetical protein
MPGFVNPSATELASAQIYVNQKGLVLVSSVRGTLIPKAQYTVDSNSQINFTGWTAEDTEFIFGMLDMQKEGKYFVDATQFVKTYLLPAGDTEVLTGAYPLNLFPTEQVGAVTVYAGSLQQFRNSGNAAASPTADGNYHETGSSIQFNTAFEEDTPIFICSTGLLVNNPADSRDAALDLIAGQMDIVVADLALATGNPVSRYQANPNKPDLTAFGDRVVALESFNSSYIPQLGIAGQIMWLPDQDYNGTVVPTPTGWLPLSQTTTTTITSASTLYPVLWARYTSSDTKSPIYRSGSNLVVQKMFKEKRTKWFNIASTCTPPGVQWLFVQFYKDSTWWHMKVNAYFNVAATVTVTGVTFFDHSPDPSQATLASDMSSGATYRLVGTNGASTIVEVGGAGAPVFITEFVLASEPVWASFPVGYQSYAAVAEVPNQTAFIRLFD